ncbi:pancreatic lipase-related protein 2-like [Bufo gargarizans]|uniref:pancreatic lipase-related protein 2-like n=1 Tax=Bufo gargarizans TaxID=30331 RepID=UPI001CF27C78|nr:pancreatic lipase-related protein 2-like [Bufo gargarizans]
MFPPFLRLFFVVVFVQGKTVCRDDIGCASNDPPYWSLTRPISIFPQTPEEINTQFFMFTVKNPQKYQVVSARNHSTFNESNFECRRKSVFIVHGYTEKGSDPWLVDLCQKILETEDVHCFCVDWSGGSSAIYFQAINNVQIVGGEMTYFIRTIMNICNSSLSMIRLIGHSLGAHAVGEAGKRLQGIPLIIVLDAARPGFEDESAEVSIDRTDADTVIAIHTDAAPLGLGMKKLIGHRDFFPNGGERQTGCDGSQIMDLDKATSLEGAVRDVALCNHVSSYYKFISSFHAPDGFMGYCASSYSAFLEGDGFPCSTGSCSIMGYNTDPGNASNCRGYYLNTGPRFDYQRWRYKVTAKTIGNESFYGSIKITLYNSTDGSDTQEIHSGLIVGGSEYSAFIDIKFPPPISRVTFAWQKSLPSLFLNPTLWANLVSVIYGNNGSQYQFCGGGTTEDGVAQTLTPCP